MRVAHFNREIDTADTYDPSDMASLSWVWASRVTASSAFHFAPSFSAVRALFSQPGLVPHDDIVQTAFLEANGHHGARRDVKNDDVLARCPVAVVTPTSRSSLFQRNAIDRGDPLDVSTRQGIVIRTGTSDEAPEIRYHLSCLFRMAA